MRKAGVFLILFLFLLGCRDYRVTNRRYSVVKNYSKSNICIQNYILCNNTRNVWNIVELEGKNLELNTDSVFNVFKSAISKLELDIIIKDFNNNYCTNSFHSNHHLKIKNIDKEAILEVARYCTDAELILVPVIYLDNLYQRHIYFSSKGVPGGGYYMRDTFLNMVVYIVKNDEIIYLKSARFGPVSSETATPDEDPPKKLTQENWDKLVELVMRDYIKRLK